MKKIVINYYDVNDINYASFFLNGFYKNAKKSGYKFEITKKYCGTIPFMNKAYEKTIEHVPFFKVSTPDEEFYFCIDALDICKQSASDGSKGFHIPLLEGVKYYFKVNYNQEAIAADPLLQAHAHKIHTVPLVFPLQVPNPLSYLPSLFHLPEYLKRSTLKRVKTLINITRLDRLRALRNRKKDLDVFFVVGFYGDDVHAAENEFRYQIMKGIRQQTDIVSVVGFASGCPLPAKYEEFKTKRYSLPEYINQIARAKVAIYVRGVHDCLSFKFGQLLALGKPIIGEKIFNNQDFMYRLPYFSDQFAFETAEEIVLGVEKLLKDTEKMECFSESNINTFESMLNPEAVTLGILQQLGIL